MGGSSSETFFWADGAVYCLAGSSVTVEAHPAQGCAGNNLNCSGGWIFTGWGLMPGVPASSAFIKTFNLDQPQVLHPLFQQAQPLKISINTSPPGLQLLIDRTPVIAPTAYYWGWGTDHQVGVLPQQRSNGQLVIFSSWSDGGDINHSYHVTGGASAPLNLTATFVPGASVTFLTDPPGLKLMVDGRQNWPNYTFSWAAGTIHAVAADAQQVDALGHKYKFVSWSNGGPASQQLKVAAAPDDVRYTATYAPVAQISLNSTPPGLGLQIDGADCVTPCAVERSVGVSVQIAGPAMIPTSDGSRLVFQGWLDGGPLNRKLTSSADPQSLMVNYQAQYRLTYSADPPEGVTWRVQPDSPDSYYDAQTTVSIAADTKSGFQFMGWSGDISSAAKQASVAMSSPKTVIALLDRVPFVAPGAVKNAAGPTPDDVVAPGSVISITGVNLAPWSETSPASPLKQILAGVSVWIGPELAPLFFVSPEQINAQLPSDLSEGGQTLTIRRQGKPDTKVNFTVARNAPGLFTQTISGIAFALAAHADASLVTPDNPATKGETITLFGTGFGPYVGATADGFALGEAPNLMLADSVSVVMGDSVLTPIYVGSSRVDLQACKLEYSIVSPK